MTPTCSFGDNLKIVTCHRQDSTGVDDAGDQVNPPVSVHCVPSPLRYDVNLGIFLGQIWSTTETPAPTQIKIEANTSEVHANLMDKSVLVPPNGSSVRVTELPPHRVVKMHRSSTVDYNIITHGTVFLQTLNEFSTKDDAESHILETRATVGQIVIQLGTLHGWRTGSEGARWTTVFLPGKQLITSNGDPLIDVDL